MQEPDSRNLPDVPALAGTVGRYCEAQPRPELQPHFRCVWTSALPAGHAGAIAVVPDGCVDVLWRAGRLLVVGPDITAARPDLEPGAAVLGARFQPGAALPWLGLPMSEIVGSEVELADLWGQRGREFAGRMEEAAAAGRQVEVFQSQLAKMARQVEAPSREAAAIFALVQASAGMAGEAIPLLLRRLGLSERTLRRRSVEHFGYGAKTLARILRFQRALSLALESADSGLAAIAADAGYADQAHLSREIQSLCGMTASTLLRQLRAPRA
ncbi:helix-turn-helix domain-containing protein [Cupriavidus sp. CV2]|uniref:helix-turn-helix domain-containing protein n=1 Tax=Cupriavidus ulmosensis TaxID=3065913 RepID=UPI00296B1FB2|nr:helix-turn-helix domain-containing protein [Cupriavidus sp. CV2]MDW3687515.1 helix-turn-helix domain-containing protein [Cupriavidus sp. CV2]